MGRHLDEVASAAMKLPELERQELIDRLHASLSSQNPGDVEKAWLEEIDRRLDAYDRGEVSTVPGREALRRIQSRGH